MYFEMRDCCSSSRNCAGVNPDFPCLITVLCPDPTPIPRPSLIDGDAVSQLVPANPPKKKKSNQIKSNERILTNNQDPRRAKIENPSLQKQYTEAVVPPFSHGSQEQTKNQSYCRFIER